MNPLASKSKLFAISLLCFVSQTSLLSATFCAQNTDDSLSRDSITPRSGVHARDGGIAADDGEPAAMRPTPNTQASLSLPQQNYITLPDEILHHLMVFLPVKDDARLSMVSKTFQDLRNTRNAYYRQKIISRLNEAQRRQYNDFVTWSLPAAWSSDEMFWRISRQADKTWDSTKPGAYQGKVGEYLKLIHPNNAEPVNAKKTEIAEFLHGDIQFHNQTDPQLKALYAQFDEQLDSHIQRGERWAIDFKISKCFEEEWGWKNYDFDRPWIDKAKFLATIDFLKTQALDNHPDAPAAILYLLKSYKKEDLDFCNATANWVRETLRLFNNPKTYEDLFNYLYQKEDTEDPDPEDKDFQKKLLADAADAGQAWARRWCFDKEFWVEDKQEAEARAERCLQAAVEDGEAWAIEVVYPRLSGSEMSDDRLKAKALLFEGARKGISHFVNQCLLLYAVQEPMDDEARALMGNLSKRYVPAQVVDNSAVLDDLGLPPEKLMYASYLLRLIQEEPGVLDHKEDPYFVMNRLNEQADHFKTAPQDPKLSEKVRNYNAWRRFGVLPFGYNPD